MSKTSKLKNILQQLPVTTRRKNKNKLFSWQRGCCFYCLNKVTIESATIDHVIPQCKKLGSHRQNRVLSCYSCNHKKADKLIEPQFVAKRIRYFGESQQIIKVTIIN